MEQPPVVPGPRYASLIRLLLTTDTVWNLGRTFLARWKPSPSKCNAINLLHDLTNHGPPDASEQAADAQAEGAEGVSAGVSQGVVHVEENPRPFAGAESVAGADKTAIALATFI